MAGQQKGEEECTYREIRKTQEQTQRNGQAHSKEQEIIENQIHRGETWELLAAAHQGDKNAREQMIQNNLGLVWSIVHRFSNRGYELEELFQVGSIGLMKAVDKFDLSFDVKFSTYAVPMITGEIKRFLRDDGMIKVSRGLKENGAKVQKAREKLQASLGREPTLQEISEMTGFPREEIVMALEANGEVESLNKTYASGGGKEVSLGERLPQDKDNHEVLLNHLLLEQLMAELGEMERNLIELRYFGDKTQVQVAKELNISQVQVSRLEKRILLRMRERIR
ncbi:RNA polymerase sigma-70 factor, sigma-B/F/G subfamily [Lachnospiraceae bacterium 3-1]|nr:RNA polymerase sigma-70 factor, sigma-B/F/G subfamily [Lachnospiraceae bacterium 3-1]